MATSARPETTANRTRTGTSLSTVTTAAQAVMFVSGAALLGLGLFIWTGEADQLIPIHMAIGIVLVLSLWTIAAIAVQAGVSRGLIAAAVAWSLVAPVLGWTQEALVQGDWHWTIQVLHLLVGVGVVACGQALIVSIRKRSR